MYTAEEHNACQGNMGNVLTVPPTQAWRYVNGFCLPGRLSGWLILRGIALRMSRLSTQIPAWRPGIASMSPRSVERKLPLHTAM